MLKSMYEQIWSGLPHKVFRKVNGQVVSNTRALIQFQVSEPLDFMYNLINEIEDCALLKMKEKHETL